MYPLPSIDQNVAENLDNLIPLTSTHVDAAENPILALRSRACRVTRRLRQLNPYSHSFPILLDETNPLVVRFASSIR